MGCCAINPLYVCGDDEFNRALNEFIAVLKMVYPQRVIGQSISILCMELTSANRRSMSALLS
jgi:hypothetical protein